MFLLGLFASTASVPGWTSVSIPAGWAALSLTLPIVAWRAGVLTPLHAAVGAFLVYALASVAWAPEPWDGAWALWLLAIFALAFHLGSVLPSLGPLLKGLAVGCGLSSALAVAQAFGFSEVSQFGPWAPSGFFYNPVLQGLILSLVVVALASHRLWLWALPLGPGIYLAHSRGAWLVLAVGLAANWARTIYLPLIAFLATILVVTLGISSSDLERLAIWQAAIQYLTPFGHGAGSFLSLWIKSAHFSPHPVQVHNDPLQLAFEYGLGAAPLFAAMALALTQTDADEWPILAAFTVAGAFIFPFYVPLTALLFALSLGRVSRRGDLSWPSLSTRGYDLLRWGHPQQSTGSKLRG